MKISLALLIASVSFAKLPDYFIDQLQPGSKITFEKAILLKRASNDYSLGQYCSLRFPQTLKENMFLPQGSQMIVESVSYNSSEKTYGPMGRPFYGPETLIIKFENIQTQIKCSGSRRNERSILKSLTFSELSGDKIFSVSNMKEIQAYILN